MAKRKATSELNHLNWDQDDDKVTQPPSKRTNSNVSAPTNQTLKPFNNSSKDGSNSKTKRSSHFLVELANLNLDLVDWLQSSLKENPEVLLTRVFLDHQRHVQKLFDEERKRDLPDEERWILANQEKVLHMLIESTPPPPTPPSTPLIPVTSNGTHHTSIVSQSTNQLSTQHVPSSGLHSKSISFARSYDLELADKTESPKPVEKAPTAMNPSFVNPFFTNDTNGKSTSALNNGLVSPADRMMNPFLQQKPSNATGTGFTGASLASVAPVTFGSVAPATPANEEAEDDDEPPTVESNPAQEDGAVYTKRCKVFFKKESGAGFDERGVANLFLKPVSDSQKTQLIVRSDTSIGHVLVNVILSRDLPVKKMNATNAMLVYVPTAGAATRTVLLRVKTAEDCDELVGKLDEYKTGA